MHGDAVLHCLSAPVEQLSAAKMCKIASYVRNVFPCHPAPIPFSQTPRNCSNEAIEPRRPHFPNDQFRRVVLPHPDHGIVPTDIGRILQENGFLLLLLFVVDKPVPEYWDVKQGNG
jgi:hypothetical protein